MDNETILSKITGEEGVYLTNGMVRGSDALEAMEAARADERDNKVSVPYQLCPKCNGKGQVTKPPYIAGDVHEWSSSSCIFTCDVCNGSKIIPMFKPTPPKQ